MLLSFIVFAGLCARALVVSELKLEPFMLPGTGVSIWLVISFPFGVDACCSVTIKTSWLLLGSCFFYITITFG